jgi:hypothetical protein
MKNVINIRINLINWFTKCHDVIKKHRVTITNVTQIPNNRIEKCT